MKHITSFLGNLMKKTRFNPSQSFSGGRQQQQQSYNKDSAPKPIPPVIAADPPPNPLQYKAADSLQTAQELQPIPSETVSHNAKKPEALYATPHYDVHLMADMRDQPENAKVSVFDLEYIVQNRKHGVVEWRGSSLGQAIMEATNAEIAFARAKRIWRGHKQEGWKLDGVELAYHPTPPRRWDHENVTIGAVSYDTEVDREAELGAPPPADDDLPPSTSNDLTPEELAAEKQEAAAIVEHALAAGESPAQIIEESREALDDAKAGVEMEQALGLTTPAEAAAELATAERREEELEDAATAAAIEAQVPSTDPKQLVHVPTDASIGTGATTVGGPTEEAEEAIDKEIDQAVADGEITPEEGAQEKQVVHEILEAGSEMS